MLACKLLFHLEYPLLNEIFDNCFIANLSFKLFIYFSLGIGNDSSHQFILLLHFSAFESLNFPELFLLSTHSLLPMYSLLSYKLSDLLLLSEQLIVQLLYLCILVLS